MANPVGNSDEDLNQMSEDLDDDSNSYYEEDDPEAQRLNDEIRQLEREDARERALAEKKQRIKAMKVARFRRTKVGQIGAKVESTVKSFMNKPRQPSAPQKPKKDLGSMLFGDGGSTGMGSKNPFDNIASDKPKKAFVMNEFATQKKPSNAFMASEGNAKKKKQKGMVW